MELKDKILARRQELGLTLEDVAADVQVLSQIRQTISGDPNRELKYSTLRRHKDRDQAFELFGQLHGRTVGRVSFKKILVSTGKYDSTGKVFSVIAHAVAISLLEYCEEVSNKDVLIIVDRMKQTEEQPVQMLADGQMHQNITNVHSFDLIFRDSKDARFQLIQIADFVSGILREFFEMYETNSLMKDFWRRCPICNRDRSMHLCGKSGRRNRTILINQTNMKYIYSMFLGWQKGWLPFRVTFDPVSISDNEKYLSCPKI